MRRELTVAVVAFLVSLGAVMVFWGRDAGDEGLVRSEEVSWQVSDNATAYLSAVAKAKSERWTWVLILAQASAYDLSSPAMTKSNATLRAVPVGRTVFMSAFNGQADVLEIGSDRFDLSKGRVVLVSESGARQVPFVDSGGVSAYLSMLPGSSSSSRDDTDSHWRRALESAIRDIRQRHSDVDEFCEKGKYAGPILRTPTPMGQVLPAQRPVQGTDAGDPMTRNGIGASEPVQGRSPASDGGTEDED